MLLPQHLCNCCSLCPEHFSLRYWPVSCLTFYKSQLQWHLFKGNFAEQSQWNSALLSSLLCCLTWLSPPPPQALLNPWHCIYVCAYLNIYFFLLEYNVSSVRWHVVLFPAQSPMSRAVRDSEELVKSMLMNEWMNEAVTELCMECEEKFLDGKGKVYWNKRQGELGPKKRTYETDYFRDQRTKQLTSCPDIWWLQGSPTPSGPFLSFILLFFGVIKISSVLNVKAVNWRSGLTQGTWQWLFLACTSMGLWQVWELLLSRAASTDAGLPGCTPRVLLTYIN